MKLGPVEIGEEAKPQTVDAQKDRLAEESSAPAEPLAAAPVRARSKSRYLLAEDLVMRKLQAEFGVPIRRQMAIGRDVVFDGLFTKEGAGFGVEVKYVSRPQSKFEVTKTLEQAIAYVERLGWRRFTLMLVLVFESEDLMSPATLRHVQESVAHHGEKVVVRFYSFPQLADEFGLSQEEG